MPDADLPVSPMIARILESIPGVRAIYLYGSRLEGMVHPESDLDIGLLLSPGAGAGQGLLQLRGDLESMAGAPVDLAVLDLSRNVVLCKEVVAHGRRIWTAEQGAADEFEMLAMSYYGRLCDDRAPVTAAYVKGAGSE